MVGAAALAQQTPQPMSSTVPRPGPVQHKGLFINSQVDDQAAHFAAPAAHHKTPVVMALQNRQQPASTHPQLQHTAAEPHTEAVSIFCNGNYGVYLVNRRGVQCLCKTCQDNRRNNPNTDLWLVSPTEFERHSGMSSAKKWRSSIRVAHQGEPDTTLGRWLDARGLGPKAPSKAGSSSALDLRPPAAAAPPSRPPAATAAPPPPRPPAAPPAAEGLPAWADHRSKQQQQQQQVLDNNRCRDQPLQDQRSRSAGQLGHLLLLQEWDQHAKHQQQQQQPLRFLTANHPPFSSAPPPAAAPPPTAMPSSLAAAARVNALYGTTVHNPSAVARSLAPKAAGHIQPVSVSAGIPALQSEKDLRVVDTSSLCAQLTAADHEQLLRAGPFDGVAHVTSVGISSSAKKQQQQQYEQQQQRKGSAGPVSPASAAAMVVAASQAAAEAEAAAADALGQAYHHHQQQQQQEQVIRGTAPSPVCIASSRSPDNAAAAAAADDDGPVDLEEAAAAAAQGDDSLWLRSPRRRTTPASIPLQPGAVATAAAATGSNDQAAAASFNALRRLLMPAGTAPPPAAAAAAAAVSKDTPQQQQQGEDVIMTEAAVSGAVEGAESIGIAVGAQYQAELPVVRELPPVGHRTAMSELRKAGMQGPTYAAALALAIEEKARADLLPRDAIEDVWQRSSGIALERAPRQRRAPGWQSGFIDPLKPYSLTGGPPGQQGAESAGRVSNPGDAMTNADLAEQGYYGGSRKRANGSTSSGFEGWDQEQQQQQLRKRARYNGMGHGSRSGPMGNGYMLGGVQRRIGGDRDGPAAQGHPAYCCDDPNCPYTMAAAAAAGHPSSIGAAAAAGWGSQQGFNEPISGPELLSWCMITPGMAHADVSDASAENINGTAAVLQNPGCSPAAANLNPGSSPTATTAAAAAVADREPTPMGSRASSEVPAASQIGGAAATAAENGAATATAAENGAANAAAAPVVKLESLAMPAAAGSQAPAGASSIGHPTVGILGSQEGYDAAAAADNVADRDEAAAAARPPTTAEANAAPLATPISSSGSTTRGVVEVHIVLNGSIYVGQLSEIQRVEMARSRIPAAVDPISKSNVHSPPAPNTVCALCHLPEAPGCHADEASAIPSTGVSSKGLGPLMPVSMGLPAAAAGAEYQQQCDSSVVWVHRQCALWSPEAYPDSRGILMHLPMAISRGRATRCSRCGERGATLKCGDRSCLQQYHLDCARQAGCTLIAEPYTVTCPMHEPSAPSPSHPSMAGQQQQQHPNLGLDLKLHCRTGRPLISDRHGRGHTPPSAIAAAVAAAGAAEGLDPEDLEPQPGDLIRSDRWGPMFGSDRPDHCGSDSDLTPLGGLMFGGTGSGRALEDVMEEEDEMSAAAVLLSGFKQNRPMQSRLRYQSDDGDAYHRYQHQHHLQQRRYHSDTGDYRYLDSAPYHLGSAAAAGGGGGGAYFRRFSHHGSQFRAYGSRSSAAAAAAAAAAARNRASFGAQQLHDSRGRFMSHAAAKAAQEAAARGPRSSAAAAAAGDVTTDSGGSPWTGAASDSQQQQQQQGGNSPTAAAAAADDAANGSDLSSIEIPVINGEVYLGGTTGQPGRAGRCAVCVVQRKGKCGTESAPKKCLRRVLQHQRRAQAAAAAVAAKQAAAGGSSVEAATVAAAVDTDNSNTAAASAAGGAAVDGLVAAEDVSPMETATAATTATAAVVCEVASTAVQA